MPALSNVPIPLAHFLSPHTPCTLPLCPYPLHASSLPIPLAHFLSSPPLLRYTALNCRTWHSEYGSMQRSRPCRGWLQHNCCTQLLLPNLLVDLHVTTAVTPHILVAAAHTSARTGHAHRLYLICTEPADGATPESPKQKFAVMGTSGNGAPTAGVLSFNIYHPSIHLLVFIHSCIRPSVHASVRPPMRLSIRPCVCSSVHASVYPSIRPSVCPPSSPPFVHPSCRSTCPSLHPSFYPSTRPSVHQSTHPSSG